jgi:hypothetical protein
LLGIVVVLAFIRPMGGISHAPVSADSTIPSKMRKTGFRNFPI